MADQTLSFDGHRSLMLRSLLKSLEAKNSAAFAAMLPAFNATERKEAERVVSDLIDRGCVELCCVGPEAEQLHDAIDSVIEAKGALGVTTTWDADQGEGCEYFIRVAGNRPASLLAMVSEHVDLVATLLRCAKKGPVAA